MNISIIDKFISNSIIGIQKIIKNSKSDILNNKLKTLKSQVLELNYNTLINNKLFELIDISFMIYKTIYGNKMKIKHKNSSINNIILSTIKNYNIIKKLVTNSDIKSLYDKLESDNSYYEIKNIFDELGTDNLNIIFMNKETQSEYIIFFLIYKFIYLKLYRSKIYSDGELFILKKNKKIKLKIFVSTKSKVDFSTIKNSLPKNLISKAEDFYDMIYKSINKESSDYSFNQKQLLLYSNFCIPIVDDFKRMHKSGFVVNHSKSDIVDKKGDILVKKILSLLRSQQDYYINTKEQNKVLFPNVISNEMGTFYDEILEVKILSKLENQLMIVSENINLYNNLKQVREYNFLNFYNNPRSIINYQPITDDKIEVIREISVNNKKILTRIINNNHSGDIVYYGLKNPNTLLKNIKNFNTDYDLSNIEVLTSLVRKIIIDNKFNKKYSDTLFILKIPKVDFKNKIKLLFSIYQNEVFNLIISKLHTFTKSFNNIYNFNKILQNIKNIYLKFNKNSLSYNSIEFEINKYLIDDINDEYDQNEDIIFKNQKNTKKLFVYKDNFKQKNKLVIDTTTNNIDVLDNDNFISNHTCQHFISWNNMKKYRKNKPNIYNQLLFEFIKKFAKNSNNNYVCKSCNYMLNISKDITESFQVGTTNILAINLTTESSLENLRQYEKYKYSIKNIDKIVEKIAGLINYSIYIGPSFNSKKNREEIIKEVIDFITIHNKTLQINNFNKRRQREKSAQIKYGINSDYSNYFLFKLENDIFKISSNDTDKYKRIKINNIFVVIIFCFYIRLTRNTFINLPIADKICNYYFYEKFKKNIYSELKIFDTLNNKILNINEINNLTFFLFIISCQISKYNIWFPSNDKITLEPFVLKSIANTFIDLYNTILEVTQRKQKNYIYEYFIGKIIQVNKTVIFNDELLTFLKNKSMNKIIIKQNKIKFLKSKIKSLLLKGKIQFLDYKHIDFSYYAQKQIYNSRIHKNYKLKPDFVNNLVIDNAMRLNKIYDLNGKKLQNQAIKVNNFTYNNAIKYIKLINSKNNYKDNKSIKLVEIKYDKTEKISNFNKNIDELSNFFKDTIGKLFIKNNKIYRTTNTTYKLTFNHMQLPLKKEIIIEKDNLKKINVFNQNVLQIKYLKYYMIFNSETYNYIGFYEKNKKLILSDKKNLYLLPELSIHKVLSNMGISNIYKKYTKKEANEEIKNRFINIKLFIKKFLIKIHTLSNIDNKFYNLFFYHENNYIFSNVKLNLNNIYLSEFFKEDKQFTINEIIKLNTSINNLYSSFLKNILLFLKINTSVKILLAEKIIISIYDLFHQFNKNIFDTNIIKFEYILNSETIYISDIDTGIGFYGDIDFVQKLSEKEEVEQLEQTKDDEFRNEGMDIEQNLDDEDIEDMGDNDVQMGVGEI
jgi:hypothetical protein